MRPFFGQKVLSGGGGGTFQIASKGLLINDTGADKKSWTTSSPVTIGANQSLVIAFVTRKTTNTDVDVVITALTHNGNSMSVDGNYREPGTKKPGIAIAHIETAGTGNIVVDLTGSSLDYEAFQLFHWLLDKPSGATLSYEFASNLDGNSAATGLTINTATDAAIGDILLGGMNLGDYSETVTPTQGSLSDTPVATGSTSQDLLGAFLERVVSAAGPSALAATWPSSNSVGAMVKVRAS